jgi:hypothetical protein
LAPLPVHRARIIRCRQREATPRRRACVTRVIRGPTAGAARPAQWATSKQSLDQKHVKLAKLGSSPAKKAKA